MRAEATAYDLPHRSAVGISVPARPVPSEAGDFSIVLGALWVPSPNARHATFGTLLMRTGLTFGTISSLYGLNAGIIDGTQFSLLVTVVVLSAIVLSAIVLSAIAQRWYAPDAKTERERDFARRGLKEAIPAEEYV
jgi:hypothetical protein